MKLRAALLVLVSVLLIGAAPLLGPALEGQTGAFILWQLRVPRVLAGVLVGAMLALAGAVFQAVFANPLATPTTVGTTAGATLGALIGLVLRPAFGSFGLPIVTFWSFAGAMTASLLVASMAASGRARISDVLLAGVAVGLATSAVTTSLEYAADLQALFASVQWSLGHLPQIGYGGIALMVPFVVLSAGGLLLLHRPLQALAISEELAHAQGVNVGRVRALALTLSSLGVAACVSWCGPIAFVGLIVPHLVRRITGVSQRTLLPLTTCAGAAFLVVCDTIARLIVPGRELPVGVVTAALGAPALIVLIARQAR